MIGRVLMVVSALFVEAGGDISYQHGDQHHGYQHGHQHHGDHHGHQHHGYHHGDHRGH